MLQYLFSICIPSYNRPTELKRLLESVDGEHIGDIQIVICEDKSPKREEIRKVVNEFQKKTKYAVKYIENNENYGFDRNLRELISNADGEYILFMGDDDEFVKGSLKDFIFFIQKNKKIGYILKSHQMIDKNGNVENFRYYRGNKFFEKGEETYKELFRKSVFISGFTINKKYIDNLMIDNFDGGLLFQLYLLAEVALNYNCAYFDKPLTIAREEGVPFFGSSNSEKELYTPGSITVSNSINFLKGFFDITKFIDNKYDIDSTNFIKRDMSKYFYPNLAIQRSKGIKVFIRYVIQLNKLGFNCTIYYYIYVISLIVFSKKICDNTIANLKKVLGKTPKL